ncbi:hypothetical protein CBS63078_7100 [Aspergillus niger]|nr:hypothetical protein CBS133816_6570 [Aspergillus niger]KAI2866109.1 hypothetical protein CBS12448_1632 [Aspergillus niger]KAI2869754.1 hypothetical protein CBS13152_10322 [Aspergillus niger]KAI2900111.1 hypothetical protein CBS63078_7100 [Aspergillus niger]KAI2946515.1 hypothetical protein CBS147321_3456 [Aspergillus niger]
MFNTQNLWASFLASASPATWVKGAFVASESNDRLESGIDQLSPRAIAIGYPDVPYSTGFFIYAGALFARSSRLSTDC